MSPIDDSQFRKKWCRVLDSHRLFHQAIVMHYCISNEFRTSLQASDSPEVFLLNTWADIKVLNLKIHDLRQII